MEKEIFERAEIEIIDIENEDIILTSGKKDDSSDDLREDRS